MDQIAAMRTFIKVVECQSFTKAANQLGISVAMTSKLMQQLEESLSTRLLSRTTRQVNPTEAGQFYYQRSQALLAELEETHSQLTHNNQQPQGTLKLSVPMDFGYLHLSPALPLFRERFPELKLEIEYSDRRVALVEEGFDLALRKYGTRKYPELLAEAIETARDGGAGRPARAAAAGTSRAWSAAAATSRPAADTTVTWGAPASSRAIRTPASARPSITARSTAWASSRRRRRGPRSRDRASPTAAVAGVRAASCRTTLASMSPRAPAPKTAANSR